MPNQVIIFLTPLVFLILNTLANQNVVHGAAVLPTSGNLVETHNPNLITEVLYQNLHFIRFHMMYIHITFEKHLCTQQRHQGIKRQRDC